MDSATINQLKKLLIRAGTLMPGTSPADSPPEMGNIFNSICKLVFHEGAYRELWDEPVLSQLNWLFRVKYPESSIYGQQVAEIAQRGQKVCLVNDFFFCILNRDSSFEQVQEALTALAKTDLSLLCHLKLSDRLQDIRKAEMPPSEKIATFLNLLREDINLDLASQEPVKKCLAALKAREGPGVVNALLVKVTGQDALVVPLQIKVQPGTGQVHNVVRSRDDFETTLKRARLAMLNRGFLSQSDDVVCTFDFTDPQYLGTSIGLAAAVGMYGAAQGMVIDPYTTFTGDINLDRGNWRVQGVSSLSPKLEAAARSGCRRVFIPRENFRELGSSERDTLQLIPVDDVIDVFLHLQASLQPLAGNSLQVQKINALQTFCTARGWDLSLSRPMQDGVQFRVAPLNLPELVVSIYHKGSHAPKQQDRPEYQELLKTLQSQEASKISIRKVEEKFNVQEPSLRIEIQEALEQLQPAERLQEPHCQYAFRFEQGQERLVVKQYQNGTLQIQGTAGELYKDILESIILHYNLRHPKAQLSVEALLKIGETVKATASSQPYRSGSVQEVPLPHIGTDESGKGDYFGPMVVAGVFLDAQTKPKLEALGVKDSKLLSDKRCHELAVQIRQVCRERFEEVEIPPETYNKLYEDFQKEGKNLNVLLAWGHARAIESLLERFSCSYAVADQFGDERYIISKLMEKGKQVKLVQLPKGERYIAVAAASILARDKFLVRLEKLSQGYGIELPKGASDIVVNVGQRIVGGRGVGELRKVAKLHHKTTQKILDPG